MAFSVFCFLWIGSELFLTRSLGESVQMTLARRLHVLVARCDVRQSGVHLQQGMGGVAALLLVAGVERGGLSWSPPRRGGFGLGVLSGVLIATAILGVYLMAGDLGWLDEGWINAALFERLPDFDSHST